MFYVFILSVFKVAPSGRKRRVAGYINRAKQFAKNVDNAQAEDKAQPEAEDGAQDDDVPHQSVETDVHSSEEDGDTQEEYLIPTDVSNNFHSYL